MFDCVINAGRRDSNKCYKKSKVLYTNNIIVCRNQNHPFVKRFACHP